MQGLLVSERNKKIWANTDVHGKHLLALTSQSCLGSVRDGSELCVDV